MGTPRFFDRRRIGVAILIAICSLPSAAQAEDVEAILRHGNELRRQGRDAEALAEFQRAARIEDSPRTTAQIALAEQALGMWPEAEAHLSSAIGRDSDPWIRKNRAVLDKALATIHTHLCFVEVWGLPAGALILVDGKRIGSLPSASAWLSPGEVALQAKADGYMPLRRTLSIPSAGSVREHVTLRSAKEAEVAEGAGGGRPAPSGAAPARGAGTPVDDAAETPARRDPSARELRRIAASEDDGARAGGDRPLPRGNDGSDASADTPPAASASTLRRSAKWISWGVAAVAGGVGVVELVNNRSLVSSFNQVCAIAPSTDVPYATDTSRASDASCIAKRNDYQSASKIAVYSLVGAGVFAAAGLVFWLTEPAPDDRRTALACTPELGPHGALLGCRMRF